MRISQTVAAVAIILAASLSNPTCPAIGQEVGQKVEKEQPPTPNQSETGDGDLLLREFVPIPMLKTGATDIQSAKFPVIDIHSHFGIRLKGDHTRLQEFVEVMDRNGIRVCISLDCKLGEEESHIAFLKNYANRFGTFVHIDFKGAAAIDAPQDWACNQNGFVRECVERLKVAKRNGCVGVKFFKQFGLGYRNGDGSLIKIDDPRFDPIWQACGELEMPVIIHTADPAAFFLPTDKNNERWEELYRHPEWSFHGDQFPSREELLAARNRVIGNHPNTIFIGAHMANNSEDLAEVSKWLNEYPNLVVEPASRINELGRQPYTARKFFIEHQDRILFGTDGPWPEQRLKYYWRFFETFDENFPYSEKDPPPQGLWRINGIGLPDEVLEKLYYKNALRILPGLRDKYEAGAEKR